MFTGHQCELVLLTFSPDGKTLASGSWDTTALLWDVTGTAGESGTGPLSTAELGSRWRELAESDATKAFRALWDLVRAPQQATRFIRESLRLVDKPDATRLARLIVDLDAPQFAVRKRATRELELLGELAEPSLRKAIEGHPSAELRLRASRLLDKLEASATSPDRLLAHRSVEVLESLAGGEPQARLTQEAKASLSRMSKRTTVP